MIAIKKENGMIMRHYKPLDKKDGIKNESGLVCTKDELIQNGWYLFDKLPNPDAIEGKESILNLDENGNIYYEYRDIPLPKPSKEEQLEQRIASLEQSNAELTTLIATMTTPQM